MLFSFAARGFVETLALRKFEVTNCVEIHDTHYSIKWNRVGEIYRKASTNTAAVPSVMSGGAVMDFKRRERSNSQVFPSHPPHVFLLAGLMPTQCLVKTHYFEQL